MGYEVSLQVLGPVAVAKLKREGVIDDDRYLDDVEKSPEVFPDADINTAVKALVNQEEAQAGGVIDDFEIEDDALISKDDWMPYNENDGISKPELDFIMWVNSFSVAGYSNAITYKKFEIYKRQCRAWLKENRSIYDCRTEDEEDEFLESEVTKIQTNTSYGIRKYGKLKEAETDKGYLLFGDSMYDVQDALCFVMDCGYSPIIPKCRQIGISSVFGYIVVFKALLKLNFFAKFLTYDEKKTEEIFEDKIKYAYAELPDYLRSLTPNWSQTRVTFSGTKEKGRVQSGMRKISCEVASTTAINGGSPNLVLVDEASFVKILTEMVDEAEAALYWNNPKTGRREIKRQVALWGTGGKMMNSTFEDMYRSCVEAWQKGEIEASYLPFYIDFYSNPYNTRELYESKRRAAYNKKGVKAENSRITFHAECPVSLDDVFLKSSETLIPFNIIQGHLDRIGDFNKNYPMGMPVGGQFKAILNYDSPNTQGSLFTHAIIGVEWEDMEEIVIEDDKKLQVFRPPCYRMRELPEHENYLYRYFQGTDSINSVSGFSNFSSAIWDSVLLAPIALIDFRVEDFRECYRQAILMNMFYGYCPHLIEYNMGEELINKIDSLNMSGTLVMNSQLQPRHRVQGAKVGISNKSNTKQWIVESMANMFVEYGDRFFFRTPFEQLKTFIKKQTSAGNSTWQAADTSRYRDDSLFSITFAKMAAECYALMGLLPHNLVEAREMKSQIPQVYRDASGRLYRTTEEKFKQGYGHQKSKIRLPEHSRRL